AFGRLPRRHLLALCHQLDERGVRLRFFVRRERERRDVAVVMAGLTVLLEDAHDFVVERRPRIRMTHGARLRGGCRKGEEEEEKDQAAHGRLFNMPLHVVLVHPEIHWNTGNAARSCLAAGATLHLVEPLGFSLDEREVRRAGLDYWEYVDLRVWPDWAAFERELPSLGEPYFFSTKATRRYWDAQFPENAVLVFGS